MNRTVVVVRNGPDGTKAENYRPLTPRQRFRLRRATVYARRGLKRYKIGWREQPSLVGIRSWRLDAGSVYAEARDAGIMSYCHVMVDDHCVPARYAEEGFAGFGGFSICVLRATQHVLMLIEERAAAAERALEDVEQT